MDLNEVNLIGRVTTDVELKSTPNWNSLATFSVATNEKYVDWAWITQESVEFSSIVAWWKRAEVAVKILSKGAKVFIKWKLKTRNWEAQDGSKRYKTEILLRDFIVLSSKKDDSFDIEEKSVKKTSKKEEELSIADIPF